MLNLTFSGTQVLLGTGMLVLGLIVLYASFKYYFNRKTNNRDDESSRTKYATADVFKYSTTFFRVGLLSVLAFSLMAFNWTQFNARALTDNGDMMEMVDIDLAPPITIHKPPPPPPPPPKPIFEVLPDSLVTQDTTFSSMDANLRTVLKPSVPKRKAPVPPPPPIDNGEDSDISFRIVERMPVFGDCFDEANESLRRDCSNQGLMKFIGTEVKYPAIARETGIDGTAVIRFVIEKDGSMTHLEIVRDPGGTLGKEALRVATIMAETANWTAGQQRGRPVRVQFNLPVKFKLQ